MSSALHSNSPEGVVARHDTDIIPRSTFEIVTSEVGVPKLRAVSRWRLSEVLAHPARAIQPTIDAAPSERAHAPNFRAMTFPCVEHFSA